MSDQSTKPGDAPVGKKRDLNAGAVKITKTTAFREKDWATLAVTGFFVICLLATCWMCFVYMTDPTDPSRDRYQILPAALVMFMVEVWLIWELPTYDKLAFWGALIGLGTYLFFAVPFIFLGLLPISWVISGAILGAMALVCGLFLFQQRARFLPPPPVRPNQPTKKVG